MLVNENENKTDKQSALSKNLNDQFSKVRMTSLKEEDLKLALVELEACLNTYLVDEKAAAANSGDVFEKGVGNTIIAALRKSGHDLWSWDYDGENVETWGADYMQPDYSNTLIIYMHRDWKIRVDWLQSHNKQNGTSRTILGRSSDEDQESLWQD